MKRITPEQRKLIRDGYNDGTAPKDIAEAIGVNVNTVYANKPKRRSSKAVARARTVAKAPSNAKNDVTMKALELLGRILDSQGI